jgi:hypothetical protein
MLKMKVVPDSLLKTKAQKSAPDSILKTHELSCFHDKLMKRNGVNRGIRFQVSGVRGGIRGSGPGWEGGQRRRLNPRVTLPRFGYRQCRVRR